MKKFIQPTKFKVTLFFGIVVIILVAIVALFWLNERDIAWAILYPLTTIPIKLFDTVTFSAFAQKGCSFICFPTLTQVTFMFIFDIVLIYIVACAIASLRKKNSVTQTQNSGF